MLKCKKCKYYYRTMTTGQGTGYNPAPYCHYLDETGKSPDLFNNTCYKKRNINKSKTKNGVYLIPFDKIEFEKIEQMHDSNKKYEKLSDYMLKVIPFSCFWNKAQAESRRLEKLGFTFENLPPF